MLARIRETIPDVAVSSDFIVGFCGEDEASFERTVRLVERSRFKNSFIFKYSPRQGTKADSLYPDDVPEEVKKRETTSCWPFRRPSAWRTTASSSAGRSRCWSKGPSRSTATPRRLAMEFAR